MVIVCVSEQWWSCHSISPGWTFYSYFGCITFQYKMCFKFFLTILPALLSILLIWVIMSVMAGFMCHLDWPWASPDKTLFLGVSVRMFLAFELIDWVRQMALPRVDGPQPIFEGLLELKAEEGTKNSCLFSCLTVWAELSYLIFSCPWTGIYTINSPGSQAFSLRLNHIISLPEAPACRW